MRYTFLSIILLFPIYLYSQPTSSGNTSGPNKELNVSLSKNTTLRDAERVVYDLLPFGNDFFVQTIQEKFSLSSFRDEGSFDELSGLRLIRFSSELEKMYERDVSWPDERRTHLSLHPLGEKLLWTFAFQSDKKGEVIIMSEVLDDQGTIQSSHPILEVSRSDYDGLVFSTKQSANQEFLVSTYTVESPIRLLSKKDEVSASLTISLFNRGGNELSTVTKTLQCVRNQLSIQSVAVGDDGTAYVLAKVFSDANPLRSSSKSYWKMHIYSLTPGSDKIEVTELQLGGKHINEIFTVPNSNGTPAVVTFYSDELSGPLEGYFFIDNPKECRELEAIPFKQEMLAGLAEHATTGRKDKLGLKKRYRFRDAIQLSNGTLNILLESNSDYTRFSAGLGRYSGVRSNATATAETTKYLYGDCAILSLNHLGELQDLFTVLKYQVTTDPSSPYLRMNLIEYKGEVGVLYNDNPKNFISNSKGRTRTRLLLLPQARASIGYFDESKQFVRQTVFSQQDAEKLILAPGSTARLANNDIVFIAERYQKFGKPQVRIGRLKN